MKPENVSADVSAATHVREWSNAGREAAASVRSAFRLAGRHRRDAGRDNAIGGVGATR